MMKPPVVIPLEELTACQHLVSTWVDTHLTLLIVVGVLAFVGGFGILDYVVRVSVGLAERAIAKWRAPAAQGKG